MATLSSSQGKGRCGGGEVKGPLSLFLFLFLDCHDARTKWNEDHSRVKLIERDAFSSTRTFLESRRSISHPASGSKFINK